MIAAEVDVHQARHLVGGVGVAIVGEALTSEDEQLPTPTMATRIEPMKTPSQTEDSPPGGWHRGRHNGSPSSQLAKASPVLPPTAAPWAIATVRPWWRRCCWTFWHRVRGRPGGVVGGRLGWWPTTPRQTPARCWSTGRGPMLLAAERLGRHLPTQHELVLSTLSATLAEFESGLRPYDLAAPLYHRWQNAPVLPGAGRGVASGEGAGGGGVELRHRCPVAHVEPCRAALGRGRHQPGGLPPTSRTRGCSSWPCGNWAWTPVRCCMWASYEADIVGAQRVGIPAVWLNPTAGAPRARCARISQLSDVLGYL